VAPQSAGCWRPWHDIQVIGETRGAASAIELIPQRVMKGLAALLLESLEARQRRACSILWRRISRRGWTSARSRNHKRFVCGTAVPRRRGEYE